MSDFIVWGIYHAAKSAVVIYDFVLEAYLNLLNELNLFETNFACFTRLTLPDDLYSPERSLEIIKINETGVQISQQNVKETVGFDWNSRPVELNQSFCWASHYQENLRKSNDFLKAFCCFTNTLRLTFDSETAVNILRMQFIRKKLLILMPTRHQWRQLVGSRDITWQSSFVLCWSYFVSSITW